MSCLHSRRVLDGDCRSLGGGGPDWRVDLIAIFRRPQYIKEKESRPAWMRYDFHGAAPFQQQRRIFWRRRRNRIEAGETKP